MKSVVWFNYSKRRKFLHILTFITALLNLTIQLLWLTDFLNITLEKFQAPEFHYGYVAYYNSIIMVIICIVVILSANNYSKYLYIARYFILLFQFMQVILEVCVCYSEIYQGIVLFFIIQPVPFLVSLILYETKKISLKTAVLFCLLDYIMFIIKECLLKINDLLGFYDVFQMAEASIMKLLFCIMLVLILLSSSFSKCNTGGEILRREDEYENRI